MAPHGESLTPAGPGLYNRPRKRRGKRTPDEQGTPFMKPQLAELVNVILRRLEERPGAYLSETGMRSWLARQGYNKRDIDTAIKLVWPRISMMMAPVPERQPGSVRQLSSYESFKLTAEARDALTRLELFELIEPYEREMLLERLGQFDGELGMDDLDYLLSWVLYSTRDVETQQTICNVFEGSHNALH
jgi:uncharacterized protein Smg (DUF494 family)